MESTSEHSALRVGFLRATGMRWSAALAQAMEPQTLARASLFVGILASGLFLRAHFAAFLDPFEDGYQNWWISANLLSTGQYWDRHSMMTQGNWLPFYHFSGTVVLAIGGLRNFAALKAANFVLSTATAILVYRVGREESPSAGFAAMAFFSLNFIDVVVSGWSTAESLATFLVFLGYAALFRLEGRDRTRRAIAAAAFTLAAMTRYEAWLVVGLVFLFAMVRKNDRRRRREIFLALIPAIAFMIGYLVYALQWGFLPAIIVQQTSTDVRYQLAIGTQPSWTDLLARWWSGYAWYFPLVLGLGGALAVRDLRRDVGGWIVLALWGFIALYTALQFGNPSYRYVMMSVPFLSVFAATAVLRCVRWLHARSPRFRRGPVGSTAIVLGAVLIAATMLPAPATFWEPGFVASRYMEPLVRAGEFVSTLPLPDGKILISESPIAAYYSAYPPDRILGSRWLPDNRTEALAFLKSEVAYVIYVGVPYYKLRILFPELQNGTSTQDLELLYDADGPAVGTHAIFVYGVIR